VPNRMNFTCLTRARALPHASPVSKSSFSSSSSPLSHLGSSSQSFKLALSWSKLYVSPSRVSLNACWTFLRIECPVVGATPLTNFSAPRCTECSTQLRNKLSNVSLQYNKRQTECDARLGPIAVYEDQSPCQHISYKNHCLGHYQP
jgi:hypothetical protein